MDVRRVSEIAVEKALLLCALVSVFTTLGIVLVLVFETFSFFREVPVLEFVTGTRWAPTYTPSYFGVLPLVNGTLMVASGAAFIAIPLGTASAIYLSEYARPGVRKVVKPALEVLAGIPTVVYGYFAISLITPMIRGIVPGTNIFNAASASIVVGIMILPMIASLSEDAMRSVPVSLREGAYALGSTKFDVSTKIVVPSALSGIIASVILAMSRAVGETMAVTLAAGATPKMTLDFFESIQTMTAYIVQVSLGDTPYGSIEYRTIFAVGMVLFVMTLVMNIASTWIKGRYREVYS